MNTPHNPVSLNRMFWEVATLPTWNSPGDGSSCGDLPASSERSAPLAWRPPPGLASRNSLRSDTHGVVDNSSYPCNRGSPKARAQHARDAARAGTHA